MRATIQQIELPADRRVFAVSDVHGNLRYLKGLLDAISFSEGDVLLLLGDLVEKGPQNIETLQFIMDLCRRYTVYPLRGNCDDLLLGGAPARWLFGIRNHWGGHLLMNEFARRLGLPLHAPEDVERLRAAVRREFPEECGFLSRLPVVLVSARYIFVHGGVPGEDSLNDPESLEDWTCMKNDNFLRQGYVFHNRWCVVGHWPATLYRHNFPCANPLISPEQRIASIDGACSIKRDGQLNAVRLPAEPDREDFTWTRYDALPTATALDPQSASGDSINIHYGDNALKILRWGEEFCTCLHLSSHRTLDILTRDIRQTSHGVFCEDSTDYRLPVQPGDVLSVVRHTSRGTLAKKDGVTGWYAGALSGEDIPWAAP